MYLYTADRMSHFPFGVFRRPAAALLIIERYFRARDTMLLARPSADRRGGAALVRQLVAIFIGLSAASAVMRARPRMPARQDVALNEVQPRRDNNRAPANGSTPPTYVFMHILKTGGTSLGWLLASQHAHRAQTAPAARAMCHLFQLPLVSYQSDLSRANILSGDGR